jgi:hypothetical protein
MKSPPVPRDKSMMRCERYGPKERVAIPRQPLTSDPAKPSALPGDFILTHSSSWDGTLIRFGQTLRYRGSDKVFAHWSHAAIFVDDSGNIIEALGGGVQKRNISVYDDTEYVVVHLPEDTSSLDRQHAVDFANFCLYDSYGWLTIVSIALCLLTGAKFSFGVDGQQICAALVARCLERFGDIFCKYEPWHLVPADLAKHFNVQITGEKGQAPPQETGVSASSKLGGRRS